MPAIQNSPFRYHSPLEKRWKGVRNDDSLYTNVVLFFFSFFSKTSASAKSESAERENFFPTPAPMCWWSINPLQFLFFITRSTVFEVKIEVCEHALKLLTYGLEIDFQLRCDINDSYAMTSFIIKLTFSHANINHSEVEDNFQLASAWIKSALACSRLVQIVGKTRKKKAREKFRVYAFSIQRTRLSRSLEQAKSARTNVHKPKTVTLLGSLLWRYVFRTVTPSLYLCHVCTLLYFSSFCRKIPDFYS